MPEQITPNGDIQYLVLILCAAMVLQTVGPKLLELWTNRKKLNSEPEEVVVSEDRNKVEKLERQVDQTNSDVQRLIATMDKVEGLQVEILAQMRQIRDENKDGLVRVHERMDKHLEGHPKKGDG